MDLPPSLQKLTDEEQQKLVAAFTTRGTTSGTYAKPPEPLPGKPTSTQSADPKKPRPAGMPLQNKLILVLAVGVVALIINVVASLATADPPPKPLRQL